MVLDLFCGAGGAAMGLHRAWPDAEIVGVDIKPQSHYPFKQLVQDVTKLSDEFIRSFDFVWASPPCQNFTRMKHLRESQGTKVRETARQDLIRWSRGRAHVIENVPGAPLVSDVILCGSMFGLRVRRHRFFELTFPVRQPKCVHERQDRPVGVWNWGKWGHEIKNGGKSAASLQDALHAMGIMYNMNRTEVSEAIPPAYSEYIARQWSTAQP
jgi:DNA (cytosine-5)-methyltransferase 1